MNCVYLANVVIDPTDIEERDPVCAEAGRLRVVEMLGVLSESSLFQKIYLISQGRGRKRKRYSARTIEKDNHTVVYLPLLSYGMLLCNLSAVLLTVVWLIRHVRKRDVVITYNCDPMKAIPVLLTWPLLRFRLIVQFEELYRGLGPKYILHKVFEHMEARVAAGFIVSNKGVADGLQLDTDRNRLAVASGYVPVYSRAPSASSRENGTLTLLYAGSLDEARGIKGFIQSFLRINCQARLLITGRGSMQSDIRDITERHENVVYLGILSEKDFAEVLAKADVCVNPQPPGHRFTDSSFPSKVVNYLAHGKVVISTRSGAIVNSQYKDMVIFYDDKDDESLRSVLDEVICNKDALLPNAREYPRRVLEIKKQEMADVLRVLQCVSGAER